MKVGARSHDLPIPQKFKVLPCIYNETQYFMMSLDCSSPHWALSLLAQRRMTFTFTDNDIRKLVRETSKAEYKAGTISRG